MDAAAARVALGAAPKLPVMGCLGPRLGDADPPRDPPGPHGHSLLDRLNHNYAYRRLHA